MKYSQAINLTVAKKIQPGLNRHNSLNCFVTDSPFSFLFFWEQSVNVHKHSVRLSKENSTWFHTNRRDKETIVTQKQALDCREHTRYPLKQSGKIPVDLTSDAIKNQIVVLNKQVTARCFDSTERKSFHFSVCDKKEF